MRPLAAYSITGLVGAAGLASLLLLGGLGRALGVLLLIGAVLGALIVLSRPTGEKRSRVSAPER